MGSDSSDMNEFHELLRDFVAFSISEIGVLHGEKRIGFCLIPKVQETRRMFTDIGSRMSFTDAKRVTGGRFDPHDIHSVFQETLRKSVHYLRIREHLAKNSQNSGAAEEVDNLLHHLVYSTSQNHFWSVSPGPVEPFIEAFLVDIFKKPIPWEITIWLSGLDLGGLVLDSGRITIRTPTDDDLLIERDADEPAFWSRDPERVIPSAVLETTYYPVGGFPGAGPFGYLTRLLIALKLFQPGVHEVVVFERPRSLVSYSPHRIVNDKAHQWNGRTNSFSELKELEYHVSLLPDLIPRELVRIRPRKTRLSIAYNCYLNAIFTLILPDERITEAVRGLESIYLETDRKGGIGGRLAKKMSEILGSEGLDKRVVRKDIIDAYTMIRNPSAHGTPLTDEQHEMANRLVASITEYLQRRILMLIRNGKGTFLDSGSISEL